MATSLPRYLLLALILLIGQTSGLLCELRHASEALGLAGGASDQASHGASEGPVAANVRPDAPEFERLHCHRCLLLAASTVPSTGTHVAPAPAPGFVVRADTATAAPLGHARHHRLARGPPELS